MENPIYILDIDDVLRFINEYRALEKASYSKGFDFIKAVLAKSDDTLYRHLCDHWKGKEKRFGSFYLNLSYQSQIRILRSWGILDPEDLKFLSINPNSMEIHFATPPLTVKAFNNLMLYFLNHGITEEPSTGVSLTHIPKFEKCYGNSQNWGNYLLKHPYPEIVIEQILKNYQG